jgi:hypothetical protein
MATELPKIVLVDGRTFLIDRRLAELRNQENPHDTISLLEPLDDKLSPEDLEGLVKILSFKY